MYIASCHGCLVLLVGFAGMQAACFVDAACCWVCSLFSRHAGRFGRAVGIADKCVKCRRTVDILHNVLCNLSMAGSYSYEGMPRLEFPSSVRVPMGRVQTPLAKVLPFFLLILIMLER